MMYTSTPRIAVIILNWNGIQDTLNCLESLNKQSYKNFTTIVVDNGSKDTSLQVLEDITDTITLLKNPYNKGFAGGVNTGINFAIDKKFEYIALLNNDAVAREDWLQQLVTASTETGASIVTGLLLNTDGMLIDSMGEYYSKWGVSFPFGRGMHSSKANDSGFIPGATGGASLYKTSLFKDIGLFDETFFAYYEDADISFRAQLAGHKVYYNKEAVAYHKQGATSNKIPGFTVYQTFKNLPLLFWKNIPGKLLLKVGPRFVLLYVLICGNAIKNGSGWSAFKGMLASIGYFWKSALWERVYIQKNKKVSVEYIASILYPDLPPEQTGMRRFRKLFTGKE